MSQVKELRTLLAISGLAFAAIATGPEDPLVLTVVGYVNLFFTATSALANCLDRGWDTVHCVGGWAAFGGAVATGVLLSHASTSELRVAVQAGGLVWSNLPEWAGH